MSQQTPAELSAVIVTPSDLGAIGPSLRALEAQTARDRLEVVVVAPQDCSEQAGRLSPFAAAQVVDAGPYKSLGQAIAAGVRAARAPVVAYSEEHSHPEPGWAAAIIERHRGPWTGVGWAIENANPQSAASWAHLFADFGPAVAPMDSGERFEPLPWHHVSYKREALLAYGDGLGAMLEAEGIMQEDLMARGHRLFADGSVSSRHLNITGGSAQVRSHLLGGRGYGAARCRHEEWSAPRRFAYALGAPLVPPLRLARMRHDLRRTRPSRGRVPGLLAALAFNLGFDALGEAVGYLAGQGDSRAGRLPLELSRINYVKSR